MSLQLKADWLVCFLVSVGSLTFLFPCLALLVAPFEALFRKVKPVLRLVPAHDFSIDILVPAYNEEDTIAATVESLVRARETLLRADARGRQFSVRITVALDGSKDATAARLEPFRTRHDFLHVIDRKENKGKWLTLGELIGGAKLTWSAIVDSGSVWPEDFLVKLLDEITAHPAYVGFAPGYEPKNSGVVERMVWWQESVLKRLENLSGGPFSLHGATMVFRTDVLKKSFKELNAQSWFNDDVVLGLFARLQGKVRYLAHDLAVSDVGIRENVNESGRRKRMFVGNLQWVSQLFPKLFARSPVVACLAFRRLFRMFWAYALILGTYSFWGAVGLDYRLQGLFSGVLALLFLTAKKLRAAFMISLKSPILIIKSSRRVDWS